MALSGIVTYTLRAVALALPLSFIIFVFRLLSRKKRHEGFDWRKEFVWLLFVFYIIALVEITVIRDGMHLFDWWKYPHGMNTVQLIPIISTLKEAQNGAWAILYPVVGNMVWFIPFGFLSEVQFPSLRLRKVALTSLLLSVTIEFLQWIFMSGISDIDDVLFNLCGGITGYGICRFLRRRLRYP